MDPTEYPTTTETLDEIRDRQIAEGDWSPVQQILYERMGGVNGTGEAASASGEGC